MPRVKSTGVRFEQGPKTLYHIPCPHPPFMTNRIPYGVRQPYEATLEERRGSSSLPRVKKTYQREFEEPNAVEHKSLIKVLSWLRDNAVMRGNNAVFCDLQGGDCMVSLAAEEVSPRMAGYVSLVENPMDRVHASQNINLFHSVRWNGKNYVDKTEMDPHYHWTVPGRLENLGTLSCVTHVFCRVNDKNTLNHLCRLVTNSEYVRYCIIQHDPVNVDVVEFLERIKELTSYIHSTTITLANKENRSVTSFRTRATVQEFMMSYNTVSTEGMSVISLSRCFT